MHKLAVQEARPLIVTAMDLMMRSIASRGREGSDARTAIGDLLVRAEEYLLLNTIGQPLSDVFELVRNAGAPLQSFGRVYDVIAAEQPVSLGAILIKDTLIRFALITQSRLIVDMTFNSRDEVETVIKATNAAFAPAEEVVADAMDAETYRALITLHAATTQYLIETARPLPRMLRFQFASPLSTIHASHRLYDDAARADELRQENHVVHPAFMLPFGRALAT